VVYPFVKKSILKNFLTWPYLTEPSLT
jgi:hypothetical protein